MAESNSNREEELRQLLTDAIEVQLAALKAGISFWTEWIEHTSTFVQSASQTLSRISSEDQQAKDTLLELLDAGRASLRSLTEVPRHTASRFIEELDKLEQQKEEASKGRPAVKKTAGPAGKGRGSRRKRAGRVKA
jgi:hypothetical protein